jgi:hypothetical protein
VNPFHITTVRLMTILCVLLIVADICCCDFGAGTGSLELPPIKASSSVDKNNYKIVDRWKTMTVVLNRELKKAELARIALDAVKENRASSVEVLASQDVYEACRAYRYYLIRDQIKAGIYQAKCDGGILLRVSREKDGKLVASWLGPYSGEPRTTIVQ